MEELEKRRICGLKFARNLNFTDAQYEEALKRIDSLDNANQLLEALIDVSSCDNNSKPSVNNCSHTIQPNVDSINQVVQAKQQPAYTTIPVFGVVPGNSTNRTASASTVASPSTDLIDLFGGDDDDAHHNYQHHRYHNDDDSSSSVSTSCYSSITSFASSSDQSFEIHHHHQQQQQQQQQQAHRSLQLADPPKRKIYIDGSNVAREHGKNTTFSWRGVKLCVDWFLGRSHKVVKVFVPMDRCSGQPGSDDEAIMGYLIRNDVLIKTPPGCNDDLFIIEAAKQNNGVIVSNDKFRDEKRFNNELVDYINLNRLPYIFVDDLFLPANDPLGRAAPRTTLDEFLREPSSCFESMMTNNYYPNHHSKLSRTKSHQRYQRSGFQCIQTNNHQMNCGVGVNGHRSLQSTKSLPVDQLKWPTTSMATTPGADYNQTVNLQVPSGHQRHFRYNQPPSRFANQERQVRKSYSIAYGNEMDLPTTTTTSSNKSTTQTKEPQSDIHLPLFGGGGGGSGQRRSALCRTKSHNI